MKVTVTLRYLSRTLVNKTREAEIPSGCTAGELASLIISDLKRSEDTVFTGASIVTVVNGRVTAPDHELKDGDEIKIMPVAAGG